jgi:hypothetical protein
MVALAPTCTAMSRGNILLATRRHYSFITASAPEPRVAWFENQDSTKAAVLTNPAELRNTVDIYPGDTEQLDVAIRVDGETSAYGWNNDTYFYENWLNPRYKLERGQHVIRVIVRSSGRKCIRLFRIDNDGPFAGFNLDELTTAQRKRFGTKP